MRLEPGMLVKTSYDTGPYRIKKIRRGCTCPLYRDLINLGDEGAPDQPEHIHLVCTLPDGSGEFYLNQYIEETLTSLGVGWNLETNQLEHDRLIVLSSDEPIQLSFF